ncbi:MAG: acetyl-CoA carboxylase biotin carboxyl carrier protein [Pirellulaceae bacterium]
MSKEPESAPNVFDVARVRQLIELMNEHELNEIELRQDDKRIKLRKGGDAPSLVAMPAAQASAPAFTAAPAGAPTEAATPADSQADNSIFINSPIIGTFYSRPKPTAASFVKVGDVVSPDTIVCIVEAMKTFNEIPAGVSGKITAVLVKDEEAVDVNKPMFKVTPS